MSKPISKLIKKVAYWNYHTAKWHYFRQLKDQNGNDHFKPILIYQMGKVGSSTVKEALERSVDRTVYHFHVLRQKRLSVFEDFRKKSFPNIRKGGIDYVWRCQFIRDWLKRDLQGEKWKIVTLIRDPVARSLADFFENSQVERQEPGKRWRITSDWYGFDITIAEDNIRQLSKLFINKYDHFRPLNYFDMEFKGVLGVDLFAGPFDRSSGYQIYDFQGCDILLIKLEHLDACVQEAFKEFMNIEDIDLCDRNVGNQKGYADLYQLAKKHIKFPRKLIDDIYAHKFPRHFYRAEEIDRFRKRWQ